MSNISQFQLEQMQARLSRNRGEPQPPPALEKDLHAEIMAYCDAQWPRWKYVHSRTDKPTRNEPGVPDFVLILPAHRALLVEAKRPGEKLSATQRDWRAEAAKLDHPVHVVYNMTEFLAAVKNPTEHHMPSPCAPAAPPRHD